MADLKEANLGNADLTGADFTGADLRRVDLRGPTLKRTNFTGANLTGAKQDVPPLKSTASEAPPSQPSSPTGWLGLVETYGGNLLVTTASVASIIQGLDVIARRWGERQAKRKEQQEGATQNQLPSQTAQAPQPSEREIIDILLVLDDGSDRALQQWVSDADTLSAYIEAFTDPDSGVKPLQVVFTKRVGRALVAKARDERDVHGTGRKRCTWQRESGN